MRTAVLCLGLALLCLLPAEAESVGAAGLEESKVTHSIPGKEGGECPPGWALERSFGTGGTAGSAATLG